MLPNRSDPDLLWIDMLELTGVERNVNCLLFLSGSAFSWELTSFSPRREDTEVWSHPHGVKHVGCMQPQAHSGRTTEVLYVCVEGRRKSVGSGGLVESKLGVLDCGRDW